MLGHHARGAGELDDAYELLMKAGADAVRRFDDHGAASMFGQALSIARSLQSRGRPNEAHNLVEAAIQLGDVLLCTDQLGLASGVLDEAELFEPSPAQRARIERLRGRIALANGDTSSGVGHLRYGIGLGMRIGDRAYLCSAYIDLARAIDRLGQTHAAIDELRQAIDVITLGEGLPCANGPDNLWRIGLHLAERYLRTRQFSRARKAAIGALEQAKQLGSQRGRGRLSALLAHIYDSLGEPAAALRHRATAIESLRGLGDRRSTAELLIDNAHSAGVTQTAMDRRDPNSDMRLAGRLAAEVGWQEGVALSQSARKRK